MSQFIRFGKASGASRVLRPVGTERLTANERAMSQKIISGISELAAKVDQQAFLRAISSGNVGAAIQSYNWGDFGTRMSGTRLDLLQQLRQTGTAELRSLDGVIGTLAFDTTDVRATAWAAGRAGELVIKTSNEIQQQVRESVTNAFIQGLDGREVEKQLSRQIGLFPRWAEAVDKQYYTNLGMFQEQGLSFRDARDKAQGLADKYRDRLIEARANNIARTEIVRASNQGRYVSWLQAADAGLIDPAIAVKEWIAEADACPDCDEADGEMVGLEEDFSTGESMPPGHPSCRCSAVIIPEGDETVRETPTEEQPDSTSDDITPTEEEASVDFSPPDFSSLADDDRSEPSFDASLIEDSDAATDLGKRVYEFDDEVSGLSSRVTEVEKDAESAMVFGEIVNQTGDQVGDFSRVINSDGSVKHDIMNLDPSVQNNGFGARWLENTERAYKETGIDEIKLTAGFEVGGYAWARQGFAFDFAAAAAETQWSSIASSVQSLAAQGIMDVKAAAEAMDLLRAGNMAGLASQPYGRDLLLGSKWPGRKVL